MLIHLIRKIVTILQLDFLDNVYTYNKKGLRLVIWPVLLSSDVTFYIDLLTTV